MVGALHLPLFVYSSLVTLVWLIRRDSTILGNFREEGPENFRIVFGLLSRMYYQQREEDMRYANTPPKCFRFFPGLVDGRGARRTGVSQPTRKHGRQDEGKHDLYASREEGCTAVLCLAVLPGTSISFINISQTPTVLVFDDNFPSTL